MPINQIATVLKNKPPNTWYYGKHIVGLVDNFLHFFQASSYTTHQLKKYLVSQAIVAEGFLKAEWKNVHMENNKWYQLISIRIPC